VDEGSPVLVVDDDPDIRETLREVIEAEGHPVVCAADGQAALEAIALGLRPRLVVLDLMMPRLSGWDVLAAIRADRALADLPVAVISASGCRTPPPGATCFLQKPIDLDTLLALVEDPHARLPRRRERLPSAASLLCSSPREDGLALPRA
jgi:CheY-like chemotaxis protein